MLPAASGWLILSTPPNVPVPPGVIAHPADGRVRSSSGSRNKRVVGALLRRAGRGEGAAMRFKERGQLGSHMVTISFVGVWSAIQWRRQRRERADRALGRCEAGEGLAWWRELTGHLFSASYPCLPTAAVSSRRRRRYTATVVRA